jgi:ADP-ribosylglycohydrolase
MNQKILGCILGAATGDAMGAATETKSSRQIREIFGARVKEFRTPPPDVPARGRDAGQVTDAFSIPYILTKHLLKENGKASRELGERALMEWGSTEYFEPFAGMTTRNVVNRLNRIDKMDMWSYIGHLGNKLYKGHYYALSSNGAASKAYPEGLLSNGNIERAIEETVEITMSSHDDPYSISGACAVAAAVSEAIKKETSVYEIVKAAHYGSVRGEELARSRKDIWTYPGPSVTKRIEMAVQIALHCGSKSDITEELAERIGCGAAVAETVPAAIGIFIANQGDTMESIYDAVNIGDETCAAACIVGAVAGAYNGAGSITEGYLDILEEKNSMLLRQQAEEIEKLWKEKLEE